MEVGIEGMREGGIREGKEGGKKGGKEGGRERGRVEWVEKKQSKFISQCYSRM